MQNFFSKTNNPLSSFNKNLENNERLMNEEYDQNNHQIYEKDDMSSNDMGEVYERMSERDRQELHERNDLFVNELREDFEDFKLRNSEENSNQWDQYSKEEMMERKGLINKINEQNRLEGSESYSFHESNPFRGVVDALEKGIALYGAGKLEEAVLAFESIVEQDPTNSEVWRLIGTCYAENDEDQKAILALFNSIKADGGNLQALLQLGVSHTNEFSRERAYEYLEMWLEKHPKYSHVLQTTMLPNDLPTYKRLELLFVAALKIDENDVDLHSVLGVIYNVAKQFDKAEEAFNYAVKLNPNDFSLWNKLGATMANNPREEGSKEAVFAYRNALKIKPNYVRSWTNMGIAYSNQSAHKLSCKYYLKAISLSKNSEHIWEYLNYSFLCMGRRDLIQLSESRDPEQFREFFKF
eukprot:TRINITY_DN5064_c0_g1_i1.p1 TRINITY_DN5064_c0_g1~~TRINITY_DN5064_c0_g1_i1.p1  ORF type:complete len:411 (-),score=110.46 TRINITY_DN5064_c0_g1_i1:20-1252(-)